MNTETLLERKHRKGYAAKPVARDEFSVWEDEQAWGDECSGENNE